MYFRSFSNFLRRIEGTGGQSRPPLQIPLRRRYKPRAQIVTLVTAPLTAVLFQTFSAILAILTDLRQRRNLDVFHIHTPISLKFGITKFCIFGNAKYINHFPPYNFTGWGGDVLKTRKLALGDRNLIGARVTPRRLELGMKQTELLAQLQLAGVDMSIPALSLLEGQKRPVSDIELNALADILHVSVNWLLGRMEP